MTFGFQTITGLFLGCTLLAQPAPGSRTSTIRTVPDLRAFFMQNCTICHGIDGSAKSSDGIRLKGLDFTSPVEMKGRTTREMARTIRKGIFFGRTMPAFKDLLSEKEAVLLVEEVIRKTRRGVPINSGSVLPVADR